MRCEATGRSNPLSTATEVTAKQNPTTVRAHILFAIGVLVLLGLCYRLSKELEILYVSALFAVVLAPAINAITGMNIRGFRPGRGLAVVVLLTGILLALTLFVTVGMPPVMRDLRAFLTELPARIPPAVARIKHLPMADKFGVDELAGKIQDLAGTVGAYLVGSIPRWLSHIFDILTAIFLCIYFILEGENAYNFFLSLVPLQGRRRLDATLRKAEVKMSKWLFGQGLLMLTLGMCSLVAFGAMHVRYFVLLAVMMGVFNIIPVAGGAITITLALVSAALDSWTKMLGVLIFYVIYINVENAILTPRIMRQSVNLMGLTVLVALLIGTALAGVVGALVAVPTAALISVLLEEYAVQRETGAAKDQPLLP